MSNHIRYPAWDLQFCHQADYDFSLLNYLFAAYDLQPEFDCVLFMEQVPQVWGSSWLYRPDAAMSAYPAEVVPVRTIP